MPQMWRLCLTLLILSMPLGANSSRAAEERLLLYSTTKSSLLDELRTAFMQSHPDTRLDYKTGGAGELKARILAGTSQGERAPDLLWSSEIPDFYALKAAGTLIQYRPTLDAAIVNPLADADYYFTPARFTSLVIAYNKRLVQFPLQEWADLLKPELQGRIAMADPATSGTSYMGVQLFLEAFGWEFIEDLAANGLRLEPGSEATLEALVNGKIAACLAVDYMVADAIRQGAPLKIAHPQEVFLIPSAIAILKGTENPAGAQRFVAFLLSEKAQKIIAAKGGIPVRLGIPSSPVLALPPLKDLLERAVRVPYQNLNDAKEVTINKFMEIMQNS